MYACSSTKCIVKSITEIAIFNPMSYSGDNYRKLLDGQGTLNLEPWSIGVICPFYKNKGDIKDPDIYRGITLLSCLSKIFPSCINSRLSFYLEENNLLGENQAGFRSGYSTLNHIFTLHLIIELYLHSHKRVYAVFID